MSNRRNFIKATVLTAALSSIGMAAHAAPGPVKAQPWSPFIAGNDKKKEEPEVK